MTQAIAPVAGATPQAPAASDVTVIVPAYTEARWELTCAAVASAAAQTPGPHEIILCVDHNPRLLARFRERWPDGRVGETPIRVVPSRHDGHVSASRTTAMELARTDVLVFLDDDAIATPHWLQRMRTALEDPRVVAVGGNPVATYARPRPRWFPYEFDWIFGCAYRGLPEGEPAPVLRLIGSTIAARRADLVAIGGFYYDAFEDMAMCHQLRALVPGSVLLWEPGAVVDHYVHADRLTWRYFWRRCLWVNRCKVAVMHGLGEAGDLTADGAFALRALRLNLRDAARDASRGRVDGTLRLGASLAGLGLAGLGYAIGLVQWKLRLPARWPTGRRPAEASR